MKIKLSISKSSPEILNVHCVRTHASLCGGAPSMY